MPGFSERHHAAWLGETEDGKLKELLVPYPADQMRMWEISPRVNGSGEMTIHRCGNLFIQSQHRRQPMRLNSCVSKNVFLVSGTARPRAPASG